MAIFSRTAKMRFRRHGNERFGPLDPLHFTHGAIAVGYLATPVALLIAAAKQGVLKQLVGPAAWAASDTRTRALRVVEQLVLAADLIDGIVLGDADEDLDRPHNVSRVMLCCLAHGEELVFEAAVGRHGRRHGRGSALWHDDQWRDQWWRNWIEVGRRLGISDMPSSYGAYAALVGCGLAPRAAIDWDEVQVPFTVWSWSGGLLGPRPLTPAVHAVIVELLPVSVRSRCGLRRMGRVATGAMLIGFYVSRVLHRIRRRRRPGLVDLATVARVAREKREAIEADARQDNRGSEGE